MPVYMKVPYASGSVTSGPFKTYVQLDSIQLGMARSISMEHSDLSGRGSGVPKFKEFSVQKSTDEASTDIVNELLNAVSGQTVEIVIVEAKDTPTIIVRYTFDDALPVSCDLTGMGSTSNEIISFVYSKFKMEFMPRSAGNTSSAQSVVEYDLKTS